MSEFIKKYYNKIFDVTELCKMHSNITTKEIFEYFDKFISDYIKKYEIKSITCNMKTASSFLCFKNYIQTSNRMRMLDNTDPIYEIGMLGDTKIFIDACMKFNDNRILYNDMNDSLIYIDDNNVLW